MVRLVLKLAPVEIGGCPYVVSKGNQLCFIFLFEDLSPLLLWFSRNKIECFRMPVPRSEAGMLLDLKLLLCEGLVRGLLTISVITLLRRRLDHV